VGQRGLGRGLGALLPSEAAPRSPTPTIGGPALREVPVDRLRPNPRQPRRAFDEESLASLTASVAALGVLQPLLVRELGAGEYELIAGERRWRAAQRAGLATVPVLVRQADDLASLEQAVVENLHRADLNPLEEAAAYAQLLEDFALTHEQLAARVGRSRAAVTNTLRLLQLPPSIQRFLVDGTLAAGHARALLGSGDPAFQEALAARAVREGLSVEAVRAREGGAPDKPARGRSTTNRPPGFAELEDLLAEHLATRVKVEEQGRRGRIVIEFAGLDDLERIYRAMVEGGGPSTAS
jgi:ParB family chromosome partitioning protein